jgi:hypothetical protein
MLGVGLPGVDRRPEDADDHGLLLARVSLARASASRARAMAMTRVNPPPVSRSSGASACSPA